MPRLPVLLLVLACAAAPAAAASAPGILLIPNGPVEVRDNAGAPWRPVSDHETLAPGMEVRTTESSTARLRFSDGSIVALDRGTVFAIDRADRRQSVFSLKLGRLKAAFAGFFSSRISIKTPTAVCAVRGTVFELGADKSGTQVNMAEGVLEVKDDAGRRAVVTSEETMRITPEGMEPPRIVPLDDYRALQAVRPYAVQQDMAREETRTMLEDLQNRQLKANEAQLGKDVIDASGRRVRLEEYLLRPSGNSFELLFLSKRSDRFDWGHMIETFHTTIPDDLSQVPAIVQSGILAQNQPTNWLTKMDFYATNTVDADKEVMSLGDPVQVDFSGFGKGTLWYPKSIDFTQTLSGPGVPGGSREQFFQHMDYGVSNANVFTWAQFVQPSATSVGSPTEMYRATLDPTSVADVANGYTSAQISNSALYDNVKSSTLYPSGPGKADFQSTTLYSDGTDPTTSVTVRKTLVSDTGQILDFSNPAASDFTKNGSYNLEINIGSSLFQGRDIDVLIAPEILRQKDQATATGKSIAD
ncbi:MAG: FecR domain-containing protein [Elusimicrobia bacterium]|nr:FecR domain-containing protein [Elusimicrobiota bacterium]